MNPFGETIEAIDTIDDKMGEVAAKFESLAKTLGGIGEGFEELEPVAKEMNKSKFLKASKGLGSMFKSMGSAIPQAAIMGKLFEVLKPLMGLLKPFQIILKLISALLSVMVGEALKPMFAALQPVYDIFLSMMPLFAEMGGVLGDLLAAAMVPIVAIITKLSPLFEQILIIFIELVEMSLEPLIMILEFFAEHIDSLMPLFSAILGIIVPLTRLGMIPLIVILEVLFAVLDPLMPLIEMFADALVLLTPFIEYFGFLLGVVVLEAIKGVAYFFAFLIDVFTFGAAGAMNAVKDFFDEVEKGKEITGSTRSTGTSGSVGTSGGSVGGIQEMQEGGVTLSEGIYKLHSQEIVMPLTKWEKSVSHQTALLGLMHDELIVLNHHNREMAKQKAWKRAFET